MSQPALVLGVLGGMGPAATVDFLAKVQACTPAHQDQDHIRVIADINPRTAAPGVPGASAGGALAEMAGGLRGRAPRCWPCLATAPTPTPT